MSLPLTRLLNYIYPDANNVDKHELRKSETNVFTLFREDTPRLISPETLRAVRGSSNRPRQIPVLQDSATRVAVGTGINCTPVPARNTSALLGLTYIPYSFSFEQVPAEFDNQYISIERDFKEKMDEGINRIAIAIENQCILALTTNVNQVWNPTTLGPYTQTANALRVPLAAQNRAYNNFTPILAGNDFNANRVNVAAGYGQWETIKFWSEQGSGNSQNTRFQFSNFDFFFSQRVTPGATSLGASYFMPLGTVAVLDWVAPQYKRGTQFNTGDHEWGQQFFPELGMNMGYYWTQTCGTRGGAYPGGVNDPSQSATPVWSWQFEVWVATLVAYNSDPVTRVSPIFRVEFNNA